MLVHLYQNPFLSPKRLDRFLAHGWFRNCNMLGKQKIVCLAKGMHATINIRVNLQNYQFPKSLHKNYVRNTKQFRYEINPPILNDEKEQLYQAHKHRFAGTILPTLALSLYGYENPKQNPFHTQEISVYDKDKLIAVSYFDIGNQTIASILGLFDHNYQKYSLGMFTMLLEIDFAIRLGKKYYYPGYILHKNIDFDYKLRLGNIQYHDGENHWLPYQDLHKTRWLDTIIDEEIEKITKELRTNYIPYSTFLNPYFPLSYLFDEELPFVASPMQIICLENILAKILLLEFLPDTKHYRLSYVQKAIITNEMQEMLYLLGNYNPEIYTQEIYVYQEIVVESYNLDEIIAKILIEKILSTKLEKQSFQI
jgi:arginine-tRNA-protein transferase